MTKGEVDHPLTPSSTPLFVFLFEFLRVKKLGSPRIDFCFVTRHERGIGVGMGGGVPLLRND